jgi:hypothetical protein
MVSTFQAMGVLWALQSSQPGLSLYGGLPVAYGTAYYAISLSVNVILTFLIIVRLYLYRRTLIASLPEEHAREYVSLATIIVESASIYSIFALIFLITYAVNNPINSVFLAVTTSSQVGHSSTFRRLIPKKSISDTFIDSKLRTT